MSTAAPPLTSVEQALGFALTDETDPMTRLAVSLELDRLRRERGAALQREPDDAQAYNDMRPDDSSGAGDS